MIRAAFGLGVVLGSVAAWSGLGEQLKLPAHIHTESLEALWSPPRLVVPEGLPARVVVTAYCRCPICCGKWSGGLTAGGTVPVPGKTAAADWRVFPPGECLVIGGKRVVTVEDTGRLIKGARIDLFLETHEEALKFGKRKLSVRLC